MILTTWTRGSLRALTSLGLCSAAFADVIYVDPAGHGSFTAIQPAIAAALDGDVLLVRSGFYAPFTIDQRSLSVIADAGAIVRISGNVTIRNTPSNALVLLAGLEITGIPSSSPPKTALSVAANAGHVRIQDCTIRGADGLFSGGGTGGPGDTGAAVTASAAVVFASCAVNGGTGYGEFFFGPNGGAGGVGLTSQGSAVALYDCTVAGGTGGTADYFGGLTSGNGGNGCSVLDFGILASGSSFSGGAGGGYSSAPGKGGDGLFVNFLAQAQLIDNTTAGGSGGFGYGGTFGATGLPESGGGQFHHIAGARRKVSAAFLAAEGSTLPVALSGEAGDRFWLWSSSIPSFVYVPSYAGILLIPSPFFMTVVATAVLPASGTANVTIRMPSVGPGTHGARRILQGFAMSATGVSRLGSPIHVFVLNCSDLLPDCNANLACDSCDILAGSVDCDHNGIPDECENDCNGNGIGDVCDIASGASLDLNHNGIPDECEVQTTWHVEATASPGGNGSASAPFRTMAEAFTVAISGDTVLLANGLYQGPGNRNLDFGTRDLVVASAVGAANCIIDCQLMGRAFVVSGGVTSAARIEGLTIRNGKRIGANAQGGAIWVKNSSPTISACAFVNCETAAQGGAVALEQSSSLIVGCTFNGNKAASSLGGAVWISGGSNLRILDSGFTNDSAVSGGALQVTSTFVSLERCEFLANTATQNGGAIYAESSTLAVDQCCFAGNRGQFGGALATYRSGWSLSNCTVVDNTATTTAGAVYFPSSNPTVTTHVWRNTVFRNNSAPSGTPVHLQWATLDIAACNLQGGQASITLGTSGTLLWGPGNLDLDPLFVDADGLDNNPSTFGDNDYRLALSSPCVDSGDNTAVAPDIFDLDGDGNVSEPVPFDFDGNARFIDIPSAPNTGVGPRPIVDMGPWERQP